MDCYNLNMSQIALYRKYRPQCFHQIIAQDFVVKTLKQEIVNNNIYHAYIFAGTRGSGKTSVARIFAHAINCLNHNDGDCCNQCSNCLSTSNTGVLDIHEIDAASNSGVDEVRKLIDTVHYLPTQFNKKVYIIDEAHMLSNSAWNALLKTIEEPPEHVLFIFATTEVSKIPMTIMSRCQRFDFYQLKLDALIELISNVCNKEGILIANEAKIKIAQLSDGSARDCLSILHQISNYSNGEITIQHVNGVFGLLSTDSKIEIINNIFSNGLSELISQLEKNTSNYLELSKDLIDIIIDKIIYTKTNDLNLLKVISLSDVNKITLSLDELYLLLDSFSAVYEKIKLFGNGLFYFKNALLKLSDLPKHNLDINNAFSTKTVTQKYVKDNATPVTSESVTNDIETPDLQQLFNQIVSNENSQTREMLNTKLNELKQHNFLGANLQPLIECTKVLVASNNGAILLFDFKNQAMEFNNFFWNTDGYQIIKSNFLLDKDYVLVGGDKNTIKQWRTKYLSETKKYPDVNLKLLEQIKPVTDDEKYKKILDIIEGD